MRIAIVHPWFLANGGAEQVVNVLAQILPSADIFTLMFNENNLTANLRGRHVEALSLNFLPAKYHLYRAMLPMYPLMFEALDLRGYDLVISSDSCVAKGVLVDQGAVHICYCHSPMRCLWDMYREYKESFPVLVRPIFTVATHYLRQWDLNAAKRIDKFVANSQNVAQRISTFYRRESDVIYPPVDVESAGMLSTVSDYLYLLCRPTD